MLHRLPLLKASALAVAELLWNVLVVTATAAAELRRVGLHAVPDRDVELRRGGQTTTTTAIDTAGVM